MFLPKGKFVQMTMLLHICAGLLAAGQDWPYRGELQTEIQFWKNIFGKYSKNEVVIHDARDLGRIYKIIKFENEAGNEAREKFVESEKEKIKARLLVLQESNAGMRDGYDKYLVSLFGKSFSEETLRKASENLRGQQGLKEPFWEGVARSRTYLPKIREIFVKYQLPGELAYLPHVESSFNPAAKSHVGAAGMWQIMRGTARRFLRNNRIADGRYDAYAASEVAAQILKYNFKKSDDWALALTAYNYGLAGILKAKKNTNGNYLDIREHYKHRRFQFASRNFYPEFLAVLEIMKETETAIPADPPEKFAALERFQLKQAVHLPKFAKKYEIPLDSLKKYNPAYKNAAWKGRVRVPEKYWVYLPHGYRHEKLADIFTGIDPAPPLLAEAIFEKSDPREKMVAWDAPIAPPQTPAQISGERIVRARVTATIIEQAMENLKNRLHSRENHIEIFAGETVGHIADWLNISAARLRNMNNLSRSNKIYQGQRIKVDFKNVSLDKFINRRLNYHKYQFEATLANLPVTGYDERTVKEGDTIWKIIKAEKISSVELIQYFNSGHNINKLRPGDILKMPKFKSKHTMEDVL